MCAFLWYHLLFFPVGSFWRDCLCFFFLWGMIFSTMAPCLQMLAPQMSSRCKTFSSQGLKPEKPSGLGNCWLHVDHGMYHLQREVYRLFGAGFGGWWRLGLWCSTYNLGTNLFLVSEDAIVTLECHFICHFAGQFRQYRRGSSLKWRAVFVWMHKIAALY